jgi:hypothetical protein
MAMVVGSVTLLGCRTLWYRTRTWCLVDDVPISLSQGSHYSTGELPVNLNARYGIEIYADNKIDPEKLQCMLVGPSFPSHHCDTPVLLRARWMLSSEGKTLQATSDDTVGFGGGGPGPKGANRLIGDFHGQKGQRYKLDVYVLSDTSSLNVTNPRLYVGVEDPSVEFNLVLNGLLKVFCTVIARSEDSCWSARYQPLRPISESRGKAGCPIHVAASSRHGWEIKTSQVFHAPVPLQLLPTRSRKYLPRHITRLLARQQHI